MIRSEIVQMFRDQCPEIPSRVISDTTLYSWLQAGDKEFCAETRCIVDQGTTIETAEDEQYWDLTAEITDFYDIDKTSASGVTYNGKALKYKSMAELDIESKNWRARDSGTPQSWFRRGKYLWVDRPIDSNEYDIVVYSSLLSNDWTTDIAPYNAIQTLEPFHPAMILYLIKRAKAKVGKPEEAIAAYQEYASYLKWAKVQLGATRFGAIHFIPKFKIMRRR